MSPAQATLIVARLAFAGRRTAVLAGGAIGAAAAAQKTIKECDRATPCKSVS